MEKTHKIYLVNLSFEVPYEGTIQVPAKDEDDARAIVMEQFKERSKVNVVSVVDMDAIEYPDEPKAPKLIIN